MGKKIMLVSAILGTIGAALFLGVMLFQDKKNPLLNIQTFPMVLLMVAAVFSWFSWGLRSERHAMAAGVFYAVAPLFMGTMLLTNIVPATLSFVGFALLRSEK